MSRMQYEVTTFPLLWKMRPVGSVVLILTESWPVLWPGRSGDSVCSTEC